MGVIIEWNDYKPIDRNNLIQQIEENGEEDVVGVPVCGANLMSSVIHTANFIRQVHYKIGTRLYIENAD
jgi:hypothetical protein